MQKLKAAFTEEPMSFILGSLFVTAMVILLIYFSVFGFKLMTEGVISEEEERMAALEDCISMEVFTPDQCFEVITGD